MDSSAVTTPRLSPKVEGEGGGSEDASRYLQLLMLVPTRTPVAVPLDPLAPLDLEPESVRLMVLFCVKMTSVGELGLKLP